MEASFLYALVCLFLLTTRTEQKCVIAGSPSPIPPKKLSKPSAPFTVSQNDACPYYSKNKGCCNDLQLQQLQQNFQDIDMIFGEDCPICAVNLKMFWCEFTCSPQQHQFVRPENYAKIVRGGTSYDVLNVTIRMSVNTSCYLFNSCEKVPETRMMANSGQGFLQFQGDQAYSRGACLFDFVFSDEEGDGMKPLKYDAYACNREIKNKKLHDFKNVTTCPCTYCEESCNRTNDAFQGSSYFTGFGTVLVIIVYIILASFTVVLE